MSKPTRFSELPVVQLALRRRWIVLCVLLVGFLAIPLLLKKLPVTYVGEAQILLVNENSSSRDPLVLEADLPELATSSTVIDRALGRLHMDATVDDIRTNLTARVGLRSNLLPLSYKSPSSELAVDVPNAIGAEMVSYYHELSTRQYDDLVKKLKQKLLQQASTIAAINQKIQAGSTDNLAAADSDGTDINAAGYTNLERDRTAAFSQLVGDQALASAADRAPSELSGVVRQEVVAANPVYAKVRDQTAKDEAELLAVQAEYSPEYPGLADITDRVHREHAQLKRVAEQAMQGGSAASPTYDRAVIDAQKARSLVDGDQARVAAIDAALADLKDRTLSSATLDVTSLKSELAGAQQAYASSSIALTNAESNQVEASSLGSLILLDRATQPIARQIHLKALLPILFLFVCALALGAAYLAELLDPRFRSAADIEATFGRPVIGLIGRYSHT